MSSLRFVSIFCCLMILSFDMVKCEDEEQAAVVIDNDSGMIKAGFAGDDAPV